MFLKADLVSITFLSTAQSRWGGFSRRMPLADGGSGKRLNKNSLCFLLVSVGTR
jgi:hypothetical protein